MIEVCFLGSGSSGNCTVVRTEGVTVLVDAGLSMRETKKRLALVGVAIEEVSALFITHEHADHVHGALTLHTKLGIPIYATYGTQAAARLPGPLFSDIRTTLPGREIQLGGVLSVRPARTPHDGAESCCYVFEDRDGHRFGMATDLGHLSNAVAEALFDCDLLGFESNYDLDLLRNGPYPVQLKRRIFSDVGHMANADSARALERLVGPRTQMVTALHVSKQNNTYALAERAFTEALERLGARVTLEVATHEAPTSFARAGRAR